MDLLRERTPFTVPDLAVLVSTDGCTAEVLILGGVVGVRWLERSVFGWWRVDAARGEESEEEWFAEHA